MKSFCIYHPPASFHWTRTHKIYGSLLVLFGIGLLLKIFPDSPEKEFIFQAILFLGLALFLYGMTLGVLGLGRYEKLPGTLRGELIFTPTTIHVADQTYSIDTFQKIEFEGIDWIGNSKYLGGNLNMDNKLSLGVGNILVLHFKDGQTISVQFQRKWAGELADAQESILAYYLKDKITYLETVDHLGLTTPKEWEELKKLKQQPHS